jgi:ubiquinone/menaquinone biosynthesis C-methylase UbiE
MAQYKNFDTYISQDHHLNVKESFKKISEIASLNDKGNDTLQVLDVGCATGALIGYLKDCNPKWKYTGIDISSKLLDVAREKMPDCKWVEGSGLDISSKFNKKFDLVVCFGVLGIFDEGDAIKLFDNLLKSVKPGGQIILFSQFNEMDVDTQINHRKYNKSGENYGWEKGWNNYSIKTVKGWLYGRVESVEFIDFDMPVDLEPQDDLVRSWTIEINNKRQLTNGLKLLIDLKFLKIQL